MKLFGVVYKHTNKINGKCYVGQTKHVDNLNRRFRKGTMTSYKNCTAFQNALKKYTWDKFDTEILFSAFDQDALNKAEEYFIKLNDCALPKGYNSVTIIDGNVEFTAEVRAKISNAAKERYANMEVIPEAVNKKHYTIIDGVEHKHCPKCNEKKPLDGFGKNADRWDGLSSYCKPCHRVVNYKPYVRLSEEAFAKSYVDRKEAMSKAVKESFKNNPELRAKKAKEKSKAIIGTNLESGVEIEFQSAKEAKQYGFCNKNISRAIKQNRPFKKHTWRFK